MNRLPAVVMLGGLTFTSMSLVNAQSTQLAAGKSDNLSGKKPTGLSALPPAPSGRSTIMGGSIRNIDPVRDQFSLNSYGEKPLKVLFDERTRVYRDGRKISLLELGPEEHASVQTVLDGSNVYALSIHILSQAPEGECQGQVLSFNPSTTELAIASALSPDPIELLVPPSTPVSREGQSTFTGQHSGLSDLISGALVSVTFQPVTQGHAVASRVAILATPGAQFILAGVITYLDLNSGQLDLQDENNQKTYEIVFNSANLQTVSTLHLGDHIRVSATYQAAHYLATAITVF